jgi:hypothetical protein
MEGTTLEPIVIAPITFELDDFQYCRFSCSGNGILCNNVAFDPDLNDVFWGDGSVGRGDLRRPRYKPDYWRAQCAFRGLSRNGTVKDMQYTLRNFLESSPLVTDEIDDSLLPIFHDIWQHHNTLFLKQNIEARAQRRIPQDYGNEEADRSSLYLEKRFVNIKNSPDANFNPTTVVALKVQPATRAHLHQQAGQMGLLYASVSAGLNSFDGPTRYIVIGYRRAVVRRAIDWLEGKPDEYRLVTRRRIQAANNSAKRSVPNASTRLGIGSAARQHATVVRHHPSIPGFRLGVAEAELQRSIHMQPLDRWELEKHEED